MADNINHPPHYNSHPSGVECIQVTELMGYNLGNAIKYLWRAPYKGKLDDIKKAHWYTKRELARRESARFVQCPFIRPEIITPSSIAKHFTRNIACAFLAIWAVEFDFIDDDMDMLARALAYLDIEIADIEQAARGD